MEAAVSRQQHGEPERGPERSVGTQAFPLTRCETNGTDQRVAVEDGREATGKVLDMIGEVACQFGEPPILEVDETTGLAIPQDVLRG
jgi:hypothetical protein